MIHSSSVRAAAISIGTGRQFTGVQAALDAAENGDTLLVYPGTYKEKNLIISKQISIIGIDFPVLDGEHKYEVISIKAAGVLIQGLKIIHSGISSIEDFAGIKIYNTHNVIINSEL